MFDSAPAFNQDIGHWDVSSNLNFDYMFYDAAAFDQTLCWDINISGGATVNGMFTGNGGGSVVYDGTGVCAPTAAPSSSPVAATAAPTAATPCNKDTTCPAGTECVDDSRRRAQETQQVRRRLFIEGAPVMTGVCTASP